MDTFRRDTSVYLIYLLIDRTNALVQNLLLMLLTSVTLGSELCNFFASLDIFQDNIYWRIWSEVWLLSRLTVPC